MSSGNSNQDKETELTLEEIQYARDVLQGSVGKFPRQLLLSWGEWRALVKAFKDLETMLREAPSPIHQLLHLYPEWYAKVQKLLGSM